MTAIKKVSEREIWIEENRFYLGEDNIFYMTVVREQDEKIALAMRDAFFSILKTAEGKVNFLVDNNKAGKATPEARRIFKEMTEHEKVGRIAIFGLHRVAQMLASFIMGITNKKDMRFFGTKEEALKWLKEGK